MSSSNTTISNQQSPLSSSEDSKQKHVPSSATKRSPLKAVQVFSLRQGSAVTESESLQRDGYNLSSRNSPERRFSPERTSPSLTSQSQIPKLGHADRVFRCSPVPAKLRPCSANAVLPSYLTGQWPKDINTCQLCQSDAVSVCDKSAQTVEQVRAGGKRQGHRRSASCGQSDQLQLQFIKQQLQKSKEGSKFVEGKHSVIPVPGSHVSLAANGTPKLFLQQNKAARLMPKHNMSRYQRNSVEGLNMEIEKLVSSITSSTVSSTVVADVFKYEIPEGHRAPGPEPCHVVNPVSVVRQTSGQSDHSQTVTFASVNRSASVSPGMPPSPASVCVHHITNIRCNSCDGKYSGGDTESSSESASYMFSPNVKKSCPFVREPPDGCERVTVVEELGQPRSKEASHFSPVTPNMFVFRPSQGSAFCPLIKKYECPLNYTSSASGLIDE